MPEMNDRGVGMLEESEKTALEPKDPKQEPVVLPILRWLVADTNRTLPLPEDDVAIGELAEAIGKSSEYIRSLMMWTYGNRPPGDTRRLLN
jgi:hypothetical protein